MSSLGAGAVGGAAQGKAAARGRIVLVGVDGSRQSDAALAWAAAEAASRGSMLIVAHIVDTTFLGLWTSYRAVRKELRALAQPVVDTAVEAVRADHPLLPVRSRVLLGSVTRAMITLARAAEPTVVGRSGRGALDRSWLGSLPRRLITYSVAPTVVVRAGHPEPAAVTGVVLGLGDPPDPVGPVSFAWELSARRNVPLRIVHAAAGHDVTFEDRVSVLAAARPGIACSTEVGTGSPGAVLSAAAGGGELLVLGRHRRARPVPLRLGATVASALELASGPVAVVPD